MATIHHMSKKIQVIAVLLFTCVIFLPTLRYSLVSDDHLIVENNPRITSWSYVPGYFTTHLIAHIPMQITPYYRPGFLLWLRLCDVIFGAPNPAWHLGSVLLHVLATGAVFVLARKLTGSFGASLLAAGLFGIHPIHAEAVSWISDTQDILVTIFLTFSVYFYAARKGPISFLSLLFVTMAMFTKEPGVLAPALIFFYAWSRDGVKEGLLAAVQYLPPAALYLVFRSKALGAFAGGGPPNMSVADMIYTWPQVIAAYARHLVWPVQLSMCYEAHTDRRLWPLLLLAMVAGALLWRLRGASPNIRFAAAWIAVTLLPALAIRYLLVGDYVHDRYLYLPTVGIALAVAELLGRMRYTVVRGVALAAFALVLCGLTLSECRTWRDDMSLNIRGIETAPSNTLPKINLADAYLKTHRESEAFPLLQQVIAIDPNESLGYLNLARYYDQVGDNAAANHYYSIDMSHMYTPPN